ncbi:hypothetical protein LXL04_030601 [Taraxacum kok-saghyz]
MYEEQQATMPSLTSYPSPNPNPNQIIDSHGFDGSETQPAFELDGAISQLADSITSEKVAGNLGDVANTTTSQPERVHCEVCNITCNTKEVFEQHTRGKKHMKNMQKIAISSVIGPKVTPVTATATATSVGELENKKHMLLQNGASAHSLLYCQICNVVCNNQDALQAHLAGKKHSSKANLQLGSTNDVFTPTPQNHGPDYLRCDLCKISCTSFELLNTHLSGKKHLKKLKESEQIPDSTEGKIVISHDTTNPISCQLCGISCNTLEMLKIHMSGKKHQKNLEKSEKPVGPAPAPAPEDEEGKIVNSDNSRKMKRVGGDEDLETKRRKILEGGAALEALRTCTVCNVVCSSPTVYISHLAGKKHAAMAVKEAESSLTGQQT